MNNFFKSAVLKSTSAKSIARTSVLQPLWKGYGEIIRVELAGSHYESVVAKHVFFPKNVCPQKHGHNDISHARKIQSYRVETAWYERWNSICDHTCRTPACIAVVKQGDEVVMVLEDLDAAGYARRCSRPSWPEIAAGLTWLAGFHAAFMGCVPEGLWSTGTYWHLDTRPHELKTMDDAALRAAAGPIDRMLKKTIQTFVHGDAKIENFCFASEGTLVAAVDFQYTGGGCGMKDVAYFVTSSLPDASCEKLENELLTIYFDALRENMNRRNSSILFTDVEAAWRPLYRVARADFHRFYKGWSGQHFSPACYSERVAREVAAANSLFLR